LRTYVGHINNTRSDAKKKATAQSKAKQRTIEKKMKKLQVPKP
jgi:hypothetical protein